MFAARAAERAMSPLNEIKICSLNLSSVLDPDRFRDMRAFMINTNIDVILAQEAFLTDE
jgi:hypothetical protein